MSLIVWLPLIKDINNQGLSSINFTNTNATLDTAGKIGRSYYFDSTAYLSESSYDWTSFNTSEFSLCCWYKQPSPVASGNSQIICIGSSSGWNNIRIGLLRRSTNGRIMFSVSDGTTAIGYNCTTSDFTLDTWVHIVATYKNGDVNIYFNGELVKTYTTTIVPKITTSHHLGVGAASNGAEKLTGYLNDVRVYDHALSVKEIKVLSQGLVCHYQLNTEWGLANLLKTTPKSYTPTAYCGYQAEMSENMVRGDTYTMQFWDVDVSHTGKTDADLGLDIYWGGGSIRLFTLHGTDHFTNGHADYLCYTFTASTSTHSTTDNAWLNIYNSTPQADGTRNMHIGRWKLEKGSVATPWQPNSLDTEYDTMGWGDNIIYDSSGYNNHMQKVGNIIAATNTARNTVSTYFMNGQYGISFYNSNSGYLPTDALTVNLWMYCTTWGNPISCTEGGGFNFENISGLQFPLYVSGIGYKTPNSGVAVSTLLNAWHMLTGTFDKTNVKIYIDGELKATTATGSTNGVGYAAARLCLAAEAKNTVPQSSTFVGSLSDVRIYATALSDEDIMTLYNTPVSVTDLGTMITQGEFVEK